MEERTYELDAAGDIMFVVYNVPDDFPQNVKNVDNSMLSGEPLAQVASPIQVESESETTRDSQIEATALENPGDDGQPVQSPLQIRASSKHLTLASPQFKRALQEGFHEGSELKSRGYLEMDIRDWGAIPFLMLMMIIHGRTRRVPRYVSLVRLAEMAVIIDYYECYEVVEVFSDRWIESLIGPSRFSSSADTERWLFISWVFQKGKMFEDVTKELQQANKSEIGDEFPIPRRIRDEINGPREQAIGQTIQCLHTLRLQLQDGPSECSYACDCMLLGALTKYMAQLRILSPVPTAPYVGLCFREIRFNYFALNYPEWYERKSRKIHDCTLSSKLTASLGSHQLDGLDIQTFTTLRCVDIL